MKWNEWLDKWTALPRGQRRATLVLLIVASILCVAQIVASHHRHTTTPTSADYSQLEEEIALFRQQLDTIPESDRRPTYIRRTHARKDSTYPTIQPKKKSSKKSKSRTQSQPSKIEPVPRIGEEDK